MNLWVLQTSGGAEAKVPGAEPITQERPVSPYLHDYITLNPKPLHPHAAIPKSWNYSLSDSTYIQPHLVFSNIWQPALCFF